MGPSVEMPPVITKALRSANTARSRMMRAFGNSSRCSTEMRLLLILIFAISAAAQQNRLTDAQRREGWRLLFDGSTTGGWVEITGKPFPMHSWTIEDGCLKALVRQGGFPGTRT